jgi:hypothetical protein
MSREKYSGACSCISLAFLFHSAVVRKTESSYGASSSASLALLLSVNKTGTVRTVPNARNVYRRKDVEIHPILRPVGEMLTELVA